MYNNKLINKFITYYCVGMLSTFSITMGTNITYNLVTNYKRDYKDPYINHAMLNIYKHPLDVTLKIIEKSANYGCLWPKIPFILYTKPKKFYDIHFSCMEGIMKK